MKHLAIVFSLLLTLSVAQAEVRFPADLTVPQDVKELALQTLEKRCARASGLPTRLDRISSERITVDQGIEDTTYSLWFEVFDFSDYEEATVFISITRYELQNPSIDSLVVKSVRNLTGLCQ